MEYSFSYPYVTDECCFYHPAPPHLIRRKWARTLLPPHPMNSAEWKWPVLKVSHGWSWVSKVRPLLCLKWLGVWSESFTELIIFFTACSTLSTAEPQTVLIRQSGETRVIHLPNIYQHLPGNLPTFSNIHFLHFTHSITFILRVVDVDQVGIPGGGPRQFLYTATDKDWRTLRDKENL